MRFSESELAEQAQGRAYWNLTILLRDITSYDHAAREYVLNRPEDMGKVITDFTSQSDRETQLKVLAVIDKRLSETFFENFSQVNYRYPGGSLEKAMAKKDFDPTKAIQEIFDYMDTAAKPMRDGRAARMHPGSYSHFYLDSLGKIYDEMDQKSKNRLFDILYARCKARVEEKGAAMPVEMRFSDSQEGAEMSERSAHIQTSVPLNSEHIGATVSTRVEGTLNMVERTFKADGYPTGFDVRVYPKPEYKYSNDRNIQALINVTASKLALQEADYLTSRNRTAKSDNSHNWAIDALSKALVNSEDPTLQDMGLAVLQRRSNSGVSNPQLN